MLGPDEIEIVGGRVIFGKGPVLAALKQPDAEIEARRAELPLVIAVRKEVEDPRRRCGVPEDMGHGAIDQGIAPAAFLVGRAAAVADAGDHQAMPDAAHPMLIAREPGDRADRARGEQKTVAVARSQRGEALGQKRQQRQPRAVVVGERGVADMRREQELVVRLAAVQILAVTEAAVL